MDQPIGSPRRAAVHRARHRRLLAYSALGLMMLGLTLALSRPPVSAQTETKVIVTIYKVWERGC